MNPITTFNAWLLKKITSYLSAKEGCNIEYSNYTADGVKSVVRDAFGYRYEIQVRTLSRVQSNTEDFNENHIK